MKVVERNRPDFTTFTIQKRLGEGIHGYVYEGMYGSTPVAIKKYKQKNEPKRLEQNLMDKLTHTNLIQLLFHVKVVDDFYLIMELCKGDLTICKLSRKEAAKVSLQLLSAVSYVHSCGYIHGDINPKKCLLDKAGNCKLADFGQAVKLDPDKQYVAADPWITPGYAAYETMTRGEFSTASDVFSVGTTVYYAYTHSSLFVVFYGESVDEILSNLLLGTQIWNKLQRLGDVGKIIAQMVQIDAKSRPSCQMLLENPLFNKELKHPCSLKSKNNTNRQKNSPYPYDPNHPSNVTRVEAERIIAGYDKDGKRLSLEEINLLKPKLKPWKLLPRIHKKNNPSCKNLAKNLKVLNEKRAMILKHHGILLRKPCTLNPLGKEVVGNPEKLARNQKAVERIKRDIKAGRIQGTPPPSSPNKYASKSFYGTTSFNNITELTCLPIKPPGQHFNDKFTRIESDCSSKNVYVINDAVAGNSVGENGAMSIIATENAALVRRALNGGLKSMDEMLRLDINLSSFLNDIFDEEIIE